MAPATLSDPPNSPSVKLMTTEELLALPDDHMERWLINGELREKPMTKRNRFHSRIMIRIGYLLEAWLEHQPQPRGEILGGEAGVILSRDPDNSVGIDVVYVSGEVIAKQTDDTTLIEGVPTLAVEILSPYDVKNEIDEKVDTYLKSGVPLIWIVDPHDRTVLVHRPDARPQLFNDTQELTAEPHLAGFRTAVSRIFE